MMMIMTMMTLLMMMMIMILMMMIMMMMMMMIMLVISWNLSNNAVAFVGNPVNKYVYYSSYCRVDNINNLSNTWHKRILDGTVIQ